MTCAICEIGEGKGEVKKIFEDDTVIAFLKQKPSTFGHIILTTKKHYTILEQVPDIEVSHIFQIANKLSTAAFESLGGGGTNIIIQNGSGAGQIHPHFTIEIIPRRENDGLDFQWKPKQLSEEEVSTVELILKQETDSIAVGGEEKKEEETKSLEEKEGEENYLLKSLRRIP